MMHQLKPVFRPFYFTLKKVFRGDLSLNKIAYSTNIYYSQFGEDVFLDQLFQYKPKGFYVDVGAFHPYNMSNTCVFYNRGWRGINIEPNPNSFKAFRKHRPLDININLAIDTSEREVLFNCLEELSGIDDESYLFQNRKTRIKQCRVKTAPLNKILREHVPSGTIIDFMSIDCEGHDIEVLLSNDWTAFRPRAILVEDHGERSLMLHKALETVGYIFEKKMGFTKVFFQNLEPLTSRNEHNKCKV